MSKLDNAFERLFVQSPDSINDNSKYLKSHHLISSISLSIAFSLTETTLMEIDTLNLEMFVADNTIGK